MNTYSIADHLNDQRSVLVAGCYGQEMEISDEVRRQLRAAERVTADEAAAWYYHDTEHTDWSIGGRQYGPLRLPYPNLWIEWAATPDYYAGGRWGRNPVLRGACHVTEIDKDYAGGVIRENGGTLGAFVWCDQVLLVNAFIQYRSAPGTVGFVGYSLIGVSASGEYRSMYRFVPGAPEVSGAVGQAMAEHVRPAMIAIGLMNCRNVKVSSPQQPPKYVGPKPSRLPKLSFRTIKLPVPSSAGASERKASVGGAMPFHMVRGHFKTYTEDAPLMGRAVGTYWWGAQARGKKANGIVTKDYAFKKASRRRHGR